MTKSALNNKLDPLIWLSTAEQGLSSDNFRSILADTEAQLILLTVSVNCEMIAPVKALVASLQTILTSRIDDLEAQRTALMARIDDRLHSDGQN